MADWHYTIGRKRGGPVDEKIIRRLIETGHVTREDYLWHEQMTDWEKAGLISVFADSFAARPPGAETKPLGPEQTFVPAHPWRRLWARLFDLLMMSPLFTVLGQEIWVAYFYFPGKRPGHIIGAFILYLMLITLAAMIPAFCLALFGTTPGKAIFGVRVPTPCNGLRLRLTYYFHREYRVWFSGCALGIPPLFILTFLFQHSRLKADGVAGYDMERPRVVAVRPSRVAALIMVPLMLLLVSGAVVNVSKSRFDKRTNASHSTLPILSSGGVPVDRMVVPNLTLTDSTRTWVNPKTGRGARISEIWEHVANNDPTDHDAFIFRSRELRMVAMFGSDLIVDEDVDHTAYLNDLEMQFSPLMIPRSDWRETYVNGVRVFRLEGIAPHVPDTHVDVTVFIRGRNVSRLFTSMRGRSELQLVEKKNFLSAIFGTID